MSNTKIEWTDSTWNPATGCTKISEGCQNCYAEKMARRLKAMGVDKYQNGFELTLHPETLLEPYEWKKPRMVFVNSMSDLFHENMPIEYIKQIFKVMNDNQRHVFQILTKRADFLLRYNSLLTWTDNIWMGVTVESKQYLNRVDILSDISAKTKFLSCEPLLTDLPAIRLEKIDWVIVGGESGSGAREIKKEWVEDIHYQCRMNSVPFFFKQWGGNNKKASGRELNGNVYSEMPQKAILV